MATFTKQFLSACPNGRSISLSVGATTEGAAAVIHTATAVAGEIDEIWIWAQTPSGVSILLNVIHGNGATQTWAYGSIAGSGGPLLVIPGLVLAGGETVKMWAVAGGTVTDVKVMGYVNRITP